MSSRPAWERRFTAPRILDVRASWARPDRLAVITNEGGVWQAWAWDLATSERHRASGVRTGVELVSILPDGSGVVWWEDPTGDETGRWMVTPFEGGTPRPLLPDVPVGWSNGLSMTRAGVALGIVTEVEGYRLFVSSRGGPALERYGHPVAAGQSDELRYGSIALSADATLVATRTAERGDIELTGIRVIDVADGGTIDDLDEPGIRQIPATWSPIPADPRLLFMHDRDGWMRPAIWDLRTGARTELGADLEGEIVALGWFPGGRAVLAHQSHHGRDRALRIEIGTGAVRLLMDPGTVDDAFVRPDGRVWARVHSNAEPPRWVDDTGAAALAIADVEVPPGRPFRSVWVEGPGGRVQVFVGEPEGRRPHPTIVSIHGGPNWHGTDGFDELGQAYLDHGYAVVKVNYRGSTGYGRAFRDAIRGRVGLTEAEDVVAAADALIAEGIVDAGRVFLEGWSWGGYVGQLLAGLHPERWRAVFAGISGGDYVAAHHGSSLEMRQWDVAMFGGTPEEVPEAYARSNPITYVERVRAPMLVIAGETDSRSPIGATRAYVDRLAACGVEVELQTYGAGHHMNAMDEQVEQVRTILRFFARHGGPDGVNARGPSREGPRDGTGAGGLRSPCRRRPAWAGPSPSRASRRRRPRW